MFIKHCILERRNILLIGGLLVVIFLLTACASISTGEGYIKFYEWQDFPQRNLAAVLEDDRKILEIKAPNGQKNVCFSLDLLRNGKMQTEASFEMPLDDKELNYVALSFDDSGEKNHIAVNLNGQKDALTIPVYFQDTTVRKVSILGNHRTLEPVTNLMYVVDSGEVIDLDKIYNGDAAIKGTRLLVLKMEFR